MAGQVGAEPGGGRPAGIGAGRRKLVVRRAGLLAVVVAGLLALWLPSASAASQAITSAGPLTNVAISDTLNCSVNHSGDAQGEFFQDTACGTFVAVGGSIFGPSSVPAGSNVTGASGYLAFTPVSQSGVTGTGTSADPFKIVTVVDAGTTGLRLTETDTYVVGQEIYRTDVAVANAGGGPVNAVVYRAGDCFLQDSDTGFGAVDASNGSVACVGVMDQGGTEVPGPRIEQWRPLSAGSNHIEAFYADVWAAIATGQPFPDTCRCTENIDNGAGLSWTVAIPPGGSTTLSHLTLFSPAGNQPLTATKTADSASVRPGAADGYTITVSNPNSASVGVSSISDTLPAGFAYSPGSTTGATTTDPTVSGQTLTWTGPFDDAAGGTVTLHFGVTVSATPGTYFNNAGGDAAGFGVVATGDTAQVTVGDSSTSTTTSTTPGSTSSTTSTVPSSSTTSTIARSPSTTAGVTTTLGTGVSPATTVVPATVVTQALVRTGSDVGRVLWTAAGALAAGVVLVLLAVGDPALAGRRRPRRWPYC